MQESSDQQKKKQKQKQKVESKKEVEKKLAYHFTDGKIAKLTSTTWLYQPREPALLASG